MSSIISDIFYGSKQNILDQYLLNRDSKSYNRSVTPQHDDIKSDYLDISGIESYNLIFTLAQCQPNKLYQVSFQLGKMQCVDYLETDSRGIAQEQIIFENCPATFIREHKSLKLEIKDGKGVGSKKSFGHIPIELVLEAIGAKGQKMKSMEVLLKGSLTQKRVRVTVAIGPEENKLFQAGGIIDEPWNHRGGIVHNIAERSSFQIRSQKHREWSSKEPHNNDYYNDYYNDYSSNSNIQKVPLQGDSFSSMKERNRNVPRKSKQIIDRVSFYVTSCNIGELQTSPLSTGQVRIRTLGDFNEEQHPEEYSLQEKITLANINSEGVFLQILNQHTDSPLGFVHLNTLLLLTNQVNGEFPILNREGKFVGKLNLSSTQQQIPQSQHQNKQTALLKHQNKFYLSDSPKFNKTQFNNTLKPNNKIQTTPFQSRNDQQDFIVLSKLDKIMLMMKDQLSELPKDSNPTLIVRTQKELKSYPIKLRKLQHLLYEIVMSEQIVIKEKQLVESQQGQRQQLSLQIQVYLDETLVSYSKISLKLPNEKIHFSMVQGYIDGGSEQFICQIYHKTFMISYPHQYFLASRIHNVTDLLSCNNFVHQIFRASNAAEIASKMMQLLNHKPQDQGKITYIECERIFQIVKNYSNQNIGDSSKQIVPANSQFNPYSNNKEIREQLLYLDPHRLGFVDLQAWKKVCSYYQVDSGECWQLPQQQTLKSFDYQDLTLCNKIEGQTQGLLPYLFILSGLKLVKVEDSKKQAQTQIEKQEQELTIQIQEQHRVQPCLSIGDQPNGLIPASYPKREIYILQIKCSNLHLLMPDNKIPSCCLSINPHKFQYSNANPIFKISRQIETGTTVQLIHRSIRTNETKILYTFVIDGKRKRYHITQNSVVQIQYWDRG